jgi:hypothetical protein
LIRLKEGLEEIVRKREREEEVKTVGTRLPVAGQTGK